MNYCKLVTNLRKNEGKEGRKKKKKGRKRGGKKVRGIVKDVRVGKWLSLPLAYHTHPSPFPLLLTPCPLLAVLSHLWCWSPEEDAGMSEADGQRPARAPQRPDVQGPPRTLSQETLPDACLWQ
jgi:hypothetical protein